MKKMNRMLANHKKCIHYMQIIQLDEYEFVNEVEVAVYTKNNKKSTS